MPNTNSDVIAKYTGMRRALMQARHSRPPTGTVNRTIAELERYLQRPMRVVVLGEHNSGKTALVNAMLGQEILPTAVVANTPVSVTMRFGKVTSIRAQTNCGTWNDIDRTRPFEGFNARDLRAVEIHAPNPLLKQFEFVDTPATTEPGSYVLGADLVIWCTNAARAWSQSERRAWMALPRRCRRDGILAATHMESLVSFDDRDKVLRRLHDEAGDLFKDINIVDSTINAGPQRNDPSDASGINALLQRLNQMSAKQREHRAHAAHRIANRLASAVPTARKFHTPPPLSMDLQLAN